MKEIVIDLTNRNEVQKYEENSIFQYEAMEQCAQMLVDTLSNFGKHHHDKISDCRTHNTIFISGGRGSGKTVFLVNMETAAFVNQKEEVKSAFKFLSVIDPTLLHDRSDMSSCEAFIAVIIGQIDEEVSEALNSIESSDPKTQVRTKYSQKLKAVADALSDMQNSNKESGFDAIYGKASALNLEQYIHGYLQFVVEEVFKKKILVLRIDDIDMAFANGFRVLEVVRRYLASPYIQTIITGDYDLYQCIAENNFKKDLSVWEYNEESQKNNKQETQKLAKKYLNKILPLDRRVLLLNVYDIFYKNKVFVIINTKNNEKVKMEYIKFKQFDDIIFNNWVRRKEYRNDLIDCMSSIREQVMFLEKMRDWYSSCIDKLGMLVNNSFGLDYGFHTISENACFELYSDMQNRLLSFFGKPKNEDKKISYIQDNVDAIMESWSLDAPKNMFFSQGSLLNKINNNYIANLPKSDIKSDFPQSEPQILYIAKRVEGKKYYFPAVLKKCYDETKLIALLFGYDNYYTQSHRVPILLIAGRFIEYVFSTFNTPNKNIFQQPSIEAFFRNLNNAPLFAGKVAEKVYLDAVKAGLDDETGDYDPDTDEYPESGIGYKYDLRPDQIEEIFNRFKDEKTSNFSQKYFIDSNFMHKILDRFYNNLSAYIHDKTIRTDNLLEYAQRVAIILLNAIAACEKENHQRVSFQNIALSSTIGKDELDKSDSFRINIKPFIAPASNSDFSWNDSEERRKASITYRIANHFIMRIILGDIVGDELPAKERIQEIHNQLRKIAVRGGSASAFPQNDIKPRKGSYALKIGYCTNEKDLISILKEWQKNNPDELNKRVKDIKHSNRKWTLNIKSFYEKSSVQDKQIITELTGYKG